MDTQLSSMTLVLDAMPALRCSVAPISGWFEGTRVPAGGAQRRNAEPKRTYSRHLDRRRLRTAT